jgi:hypothetical protein
MQQRDDENSEKLLPEREIMIKNWKKALLHIIIEDVCGSDTTDVTTYLLAMCLGSSATPAL